MIPHETDPFYQYFSSTEKGIRAKKAVEHLAYVEITLTFASAS
jgi:hypothetical protein